MAPRVSTRRCGDESEELCNEFGIYRGLIKSPYDVGDFYSKEIIANKKFMAEPLPADRAGIISAVRSVNITKGCCHCRRL